MAHRVTVLGAGSWGTTVASIASRNAATILWARNPDTAREVCERHQNERYLPGVTLPAALGATDSMEEALRDTDVLVLGVPSKSFRDTLAEAKNFLQPGVPVVSLAKGLEEGTMLRMTQVIQAVLPGHPTAVLTGPNLAREVLAGYAAASVIAAEDERLAHQLQSVFHTGGFRVYTNTDVIGCELGGALKNVIAIAAGMADGLGVGDNTRAAVITRGLAEITRLGVAMGGQPATFAGLTGMGDLIATCISPQSRNRHVGEQLGRGRKIENIIEEMHMVAEGVKSSRVVIELGERYGVELNICLWVYKVIFEDNTATDAYANLRPPPRSELHGD